MPQVIFIFSEWIFVKQIIDSSTSFCFGENRFWKKCCLGEWVIFFCLGCDGKNLGASFEWRKKWVKMPRFNAFSRNVNTINLFTVLLILMWGLICPQKTEVNRKRKRVSWNRGSRHLSTLVMGFQENSMQTLSAVFSVIKRIASKSSILFHFVIIEFFWFA